MELKVYLYTLADNCYIWFDAEFISAGRGRNVGRDCNGRLENFTHALTAKAHGRESPGSVSLSLWEPQVVSDQSVHCDHAWAKGEAQCACIFILRAIS